MASDKELKLCYVDEPWAYFTTQSLDEQWGDDWGDAPYEYNAGKPYEPHGDDESWEIVYVAYSSELVEPKDGHHSSPWTVKQINAGAVAWLRSPSWCNKPVVVIPAGTTLDDFRRIIKSSGGKVYEETK
jgi:hypothetical protein